MEFVLGFLTEYAVELGAGAAGIAIFEYIFAPFRALRRKLKGPEKVEISNSDVLSAPQPVEVSVTPATQDGGLLTISLDDYERRLAEKLKEKEVELAKAHDTGKAELLQQIEELRRRADDPEQALKEAKTTIAKLEDALARESNQISADKLAESTEALEAGDFTLADALFAEIEAKEQLAVERTARAAFARGEIAEQEFRWADAAKHYLRAARLAPNFQRLNKARWLKSNTGDYTKALSLGEEMIEAAKSEFGVNTADYAIALNNHALAYNALGRYDEAEPLFKQALEIDKATIGEAHPDYATHLNNLALLYDNMGRYDKAEPLYKQALDIGKATIGEAHPNYATRLNNLANLYESMERYDEAEPLYLQAIEILETKLGHEHPNTIGGKANYARLLEKRQ